MLRGRAGDLGSGRQCGLRLNGSLELDGSGERRLIDKADERPWDDDDDALSLELLVGL